MPDVVLEKLRKCYAGPDGQVVEALGGLTLSIASQSLLVVVGPSGSGKTSLLRVIAGLEEPTRGTVSLDAQIVNSVPPEARDVAMVFQEPCLYPHLTVEDNLSLGLRLRRVPKADSRKRVGEAVELLGLGKLLSRFPTALSGGERQKVALGRAIVLKPKLLLLDEPFSNLDAPLRAELRREVRKLHDALAATMVYVTHDQHEAMSLGGRMAVLNRGMLLQEGTARELYEEPADLFTARFLGSPPMNLFEGTLAEHSGRLWFHELESTGLQFALATPFQTRPQVERVVFGIRPEHVTPIPGAGAVQGPTLLGRTEALEFAGAETLLFVGRGGSSVCARAPADFDSAIQAHVRVALDVQKGHFFDSVSGIRLR